MNRFLLAFSLSPSPLYLIYRYLIYPRIPVPENSAFGIGDVIDHWLFALFAFMLTGFCAYALFLFFKGRRSEARSLGFTLLISILLFGTVSGYWIGFARLNF